MLSGALIATVSSAPIGVSNIVNLIALEIVQNVTLDAYSNDVCPGNTRAIVYVIFNVLVVKKKLPKKLPVIHYDIEESFFANTFIR